LERDNKREGKTGLGGNFAEAEDFRDGVGEKGFLSGRRRAM